MDMFDYVITHGMNNVNSELKRHGLELRRCEIPRPGRKKATVVDPEKPQLFPCELDGETYENPSQMARALEVRPGQIYYHLKVGKTPRQIWDLYFQEGECD